MKNHEIGFVPTVKETLLSQEELQLATLAFVKWFYNVRWASHFITGYFQGYLTTIFTITTIKSHHNDIIFGAKNLQKPNKFACRLMDRIKALRPSQSQSSAWNGANPRALHPCWLMDLLGCSMCLFMSLLGFLVGDTGVKPLFISSIYDLWQQNVVPSDSHKFMPIHNYVPSCCDFQRSSQSVTNGDLFKPRLGHSGPSALPRDPKFQIWPPAGAKWNGFFIFFLTSN